MVMRYHQETKHHFNRYARALGYLLLGEPQLQPPLPDMLADCTRLKISFLWFQCSKRYGQEPQKSNATLHVRIFRPLQRYRLPNELTRQLVARFGE